MAPNAPPTLVIKIQSKLLDLSTRQLQDIIRSIDDVNLANGIEELSDIELRKRILDYMTGDQLKSLDNEVMSQLQRLDDLITDQLQRTDARDEGPAQPTLEDPGKGSTPTRRSPVGVGTIVAITAGAVGAVGTVALAPVVLGAVGFTSAGIAAGSYAASMMSAAAVANGGGVAAGSLVAVLQSAGAAGLSGAATAAVASAGAGAGAFVVAGVNQLTRLFHRDKPVN